MGSDYCYQDIASWEEIAGVRVPKDRWGQYLDWEDVRDDQARDLTSPYGSLCFAVGFGSEDDPEETYEERGDWFRCFDYASLPDGRWILHAVDNSESGGFIEDAGYEVVPADQAVATAVGMIDEALEIIGNVGQEHDEKGWNQNPYFFAREVASRLKIEPFVSMTYDELRHSRLIPPITDKED